MELLFSGRDSWSVTRYETLQGNHIHKGGKFPGVFSCESDLPSFLGKKLVLVLTSFKEREHVDISIIYQLAKKLNNLLEG